MEAREGVREREAEAARLEAEIAEVCGLLNAATGRLVSLIGQVLATEAWQGAGINSAEHWVMWQCGVSRARAKTLVTMARRLPELAQTRAALEAGELSSDQVGVIVRHCPAVHEAEVAELARSTTVAQLQHSLGRYCFEDGAKPAEPHEEEDATSPPETERPERRRASFGYDEEGNWRLWALLPPDEGARFEQALKAAREELFAKGEETEDAANVALVSWADALVAVAERSLGAEAVLRPARDRHLVYLHLRADSVAAQLHTDPSLHPGLRRYLLCDARVRAVLEEGAKAVSVGRAFRVVPTRTRVVVEDRDGGCRVPGCDRRRRVEVHHITHWEDGGPTDTANLVALCARHHRLHHRGGLGITGDADDPNGLVFTDARGRRLTGCGRPAPPGPNLRASTEQLNLRPSAYVHPTGERMDYFAVRFNEPRSA